MFIWRTLTVTLLKEYLSFLGSTKWILWVWQRSITQLGRGGFRASPSLWITWRGQQCQRDNQIPSTAFSLKEEAANMQPLIVSFFQQKWDKYTETHIETYSPSSSTSFLNKDWSSSQGQCDNAIQNLCCSLFPGSRQQVLPIHLNYTTYFILKWHFRYPHTEY